MSLRRILHAGPESRTTRIRPQIQKFEIAFVLLTKGYSGSATPDRIDIELDGSIAERYAFEYRIAAVESHQSVKEAQLAKELRVLLSLPVVSRHGDRDRFGGLGNRKC